MCLEAPLALRGVVLLMHLLVASAGIKRVSPAVSSKPAQVHRPAAQVQGAPTAGHDTLIADSPAKLATLYECGNVSALLAERILNRRRSIRYAVVLLHAGGRCSSETQHTCFLDQIGRRMASHEIFNAYFCVRLLRRANINQTRAVRRLAHGSMTKLS